MRLSACAGLVLGLLLAAATAGFSSGDFEDGDRISGSGNVATEDRDVPAFTAIDLEGSGNVTIRQGGSHAVAVETDDNILPVVKTEVVGGVLHLGFKRGTRVNRMTRLEFTVSARQLSGVAISGSGNVRTATPLRAEAIALDIRGSGGIDCEADAKSLTAAIGGSGGIAVKGHADRLTVTIDGSGSVRARELTSAFADVRISGSGNAIVNATNTARIDVSGSGSVEYGGGAKASIHSTGSGSIREY